MLTSLTRPLRKRLGLKLALVATIVPVLMLLAFGRAATVSDRREFHAAYLDRAAATARITASALREPAAMSDWSVIEEFVTTTVRAERALAFAYVERTDQKRIACTGNEQLTEAVLTGNGIVERRFAVQRAPIDVDGRTLGWVVIGLSLHAPEAALARRTQALLMSAAGVGLLTALVLLLTLRQQVMRPLRALGAQVGELGQGNYERPVELGRIDELGGLADALDRMRCELRKSWRELKDQHAEQLRLLDQLSAALQEARAADIAKGRFLATVSHEVRTPLNGIVGMAGLLELSRLDDEQRDFVATLVRSGEGLCRIIDDVLDFSKLDSHEVELRPVEADVVECAREVLELAAAGLDPTRVSATLVVGDAVPSSLLCDPLRLRQVLGNLVGNAVKYTERGSIVVRIDVAGSTVANQRESSLRFEVKDSGIGIAGEDLERIFMPFSQVDDSDSRRYGGTGLGLALSRKLIELMGGEIGVESEPGVGSTFWFTVQVGHTDAALRQRSAREPARRNNEIQVAACDVPRRAATLASLMRLEARPAAGSAPEPTTASSSVLLAEDNPVNQTLAKRLLERFGLRVRIANDGIEAIEQWTREHPDLVLMDCQMPRLDGFGATERIRALEAAGGLPATPVIAVTANAMPGDRERCLAHGMDDYLAKPYNPAQLREIVERWLAIGRDVRADARA
jgi:signal transduction histidine kinase/CheY-like chemotaxis protein